MFKTRASYNSGRPNVCFDLQHAIYSMYNLKRNSNYSSMWKHTGDISLAWYFLLSAHITEFFTDSPSIYTVLTTAEVTQCD
jgi:hypothetical protein